MVTTTLLMNDTDGFYIRSLKQVQLHHLDCWILGFNQQPYWSSHVTVTLLMSGC